MFRICCTIISVISPVYSQWADNAAGWFENSGASKQAAKKFALLYALAWANGLNPRITSIFRDPAKQKAMQEQWDRGNRAGLIARPADNSAHTRTGFLNRPNSTAMDMPSNNSRAVDTIAREVGLGAGSAFSKPDPGHYFLP